MASDVQNDWYEVVEGGTLEQGDILFKCPVFVPDEIDLPYVKEQEVAGEFYEFDVIVMTQSCDLENKKIADVVLCAHWDLKAAQKNDPTLGQGGALKEIKAGRRPRYTLLNKYSLSEPALEVRVVDCSKVFCLPLTFVQKLATQHGPRLRLRSPYREHLSQAFARFFMRVGLPQDIEL